MFICINKNPDGSHAFQHGGFLEEGWAYWDTNKVLVPTSFPYVDIVVEDVVHDAVTQVLPAPGADGETVTTVVVSPAYTRMEVVSATERDVPEIPVQDEPTQFDQIEAQVTYTAMMTDTLLEV